MAAARPVTLSFSKGVARVGALIQADLPGAFTAQIQLFNGATALGSFTVASSTAGDPVYLGSDRSDRGQHHQGDVQPDCLCVSLHRLWPGYGRDEYGS